MYDTREKMAAAIFSRYVPLWKTSRERKQIYELF